MLKLALDIDFNSFNITSLSSGLKLDGIKVIFTSFKRFEFARMYLMSRFSSPLPLYSFHSKKRRWDDKHRGTKLGWFHDNGRFPG